MVKIIDDRPKFKVQQDLKGRRLEYVEMPIYGGPRPAERKIWMENNSIAMNYIHYSGAPSVCMKQMLGKIDKTQIEKTNLDELQKIINDENGEKLDAKSLKVLYDYINQGKQKAYDGRDFVFAIRSFHEPQGHITIWPVASYENKVKSEQDEIPYMFGKNKKLYDGVSSFKELATEIEKENSKNKEPEMGS